MAEVNPQQPLDYASLLRQLVQMASTPNHPDQQAALRHLVLMHQAFGQGGTQVAGDSRVYTPNPPLFPPSGGSTNPGGNPINLPYGWIGGFRPANQALLGKPTGGGPIG